MKVYAYTNAKLLKQSPFLESYQNTLSEMLEGKQIDIEWYFNYLPGSVVFMTEDNNVITSICVVSAAQNYEFPISEIEVSDASTYMITSVYTKLSHRKKGHAKKMIQSVIKYYPRLVLETYAHWVPAMTLYLSTGFKPTDTKKSDIGHIILFKHGDISAGYKN